MNDNELIDKMEKIRANNNRNWMDIVRLALRLDSVETKKIIAEIVDHDKQIANILEELAK